MDHLELGRRAAKAAWRSLIREYGDPLRAADIVQDREESGAADELAAEAVITELGDELPGYPTVEFMEEFKAEMERLATEAEDEVLNEHTTVGTR